MPKTEPKSASGAQMPERAEYTLRSSTKAGTSSTEEEYLHHFPYEHSGRNSVVGVLLALGKISLRYIPRQMVASGRGRKSIGLANASQSTDDRRQFTFTATIIRDRVTAIR